MLIGLMQLVRKLRTASLWHACLMHTSLQRTKKELLREKHRHFAILKPHVGSFSV